jgi:hypothetical protein
MIDIVPVANYQNIGNCSDIGQNSQIHIVHLSNHWNRTGHFAMLMSNLKIDIAFVDCFQSTDSYSDIGQNNQMNIDYKNSR